MEGYVISMKKIVQQIILEANSFKYSKSFFSNEIGEQRGLNIIKRKTMTLYAMQETLWSIRSCLLPIINPSFQAGLLSFLHNRRDRSHA